MSRAADILRLLRAFESRNVTFIEPDLSRPVVWKSAEGVRVRDADGKTYLDLTAAFGVAAAGHANPRVVKAARRQMTRLLHAMGDVHPHEMKAKLARELSRLTFERWTGCNLKSQISNLKSPRLTAKTLFGNSGFEAVEAALKTAMLATGKRGIIAFTGAYHGLGYGTLNATFRGHFRAPFQSQLGGFGHFVHFPGRTEELEKTETQILRLFKRKKIGAILVEPVQGRGGIHVPPAGFLPSLRRLCNEYDALLVVDEIYTGFGRTGRWFACEHTGTVPDLICLGKALAGGFPLSACVGRADLMDAAWPPATGEAIHTSTFLGHPVGCAMALSQIEEIRKRGLVLRSAKLGKQLLHRLSTLNSLPTCPPRRRFGRREPRHWQDPQLPASPKPGAGGSAFNLIARGLGLMVGIELRSADGTPATAMTQSVIKCMLDRGFILLPEGEHGNVISFTPPLTISAVQLGNAVRALAEVLKIIGRR